MANTDIRRKQRVDNDQRAMRQLTAAVDGYRRHPVSELQQQGLIQSFEFTPELAWNVLQDHREFEGIQRLVGSRSTVREAFKRLDQRWRNLDGHDRQAHPLQPHLKRRSGAGYRERCGRGLPRGLSGAAASPSGATVI